MKYESEPRVFAIGVSVKGTKFTFEGSDEQKDLRQTPQQKLNYEIRDWGCSMNNVKSIFARIKTYLGWIYDNTLDGNCN